jgi:hypothetical protein
LNRPSIVPTNYKHTSDVQVTVYKDDEESDSRNNEQRKTAAQQKNRQPEVSKSTRRK